MRVIEAKIKNLQVKPAVHDDDGLIDKDPVGQITLTVPLDNQTATAEFVALFKILTSEWVELDIDTFQKTLPPGTE